VPLPTLGIIPEESSPGGPKTGSSLNSGRIRLVVDPKWGADHARTLQTSQHLISSNVATYSHIDWVAGMAAAMSYDGVSYYS
jgi:hypothetical protein